MIKQNRSLSRGLRILRVFNEEPRPTLARIAASVELDKTTCRRFLLTLQEEGYVEYDETLKRYQLRPLVLELGFAALGSMSVPGVAAPYMQDLANQTGGALNLTTLDGDEVVLVGRAVAEAPRRACPRGALLRSHSFLQGQANRPSRDATATGRDAGNVAVCHQFQRPAAAPAPGPGTCSKGADSLGLAARPHIESAAQERSVIGPEPPSP